MEKLVRWGLVLVGVWTVLSSRAPAVDLLPPDRPIAEVVDHYVDVRLTEEKVTPAPAADDANVIRRLTLDLVGRIPTAAETRAYLEATDPEKRTKLVDALMASPGYVRHQANEFDAVLMAGTSGSLRGYLKKAFQAGRTWDQVFREIMLADESDETRKGSSDFLKPRAKDLDRLTSDVSSIFFGVNVSCAKCHDHPRVKDWKQDHFYGMKSFLGRTFENGDFLGERSYGVVKFKTTEGQEKQAKFMFLTGRTVDVPGTAEPTKEEQRKERRALEEARKKKTAPAPPAVSARAQLVEVALQPGERDFFARAIVNRLWYRLFGHGLVMPLDQMHSENPPSHPELLEWLARDTIEHGYDLRRLTRGLVLSRAYARTSRWESGETPRPSLFAVALVRPLTPIQLATSMWIGASDPELFAKPDAGAIGQRIEGLEGRAQGLAEAIARPGEEYSIGVSEALLMSNSDRLKELLAEGGDRLVTRLVQTADRGERVELAVRSVLSRPPADDEGSLLGEFLLGHEDRPIEGCRQLVWALLTSAEFRFNY